MLWWRPTRELIWKLSSKTVGCRVLAMCENTCALCCLSLDAFCCFRCGYQVDYFQIDHQTMNLCFSRFSCLPRCAFRERSVDSKVFGPFSLDFIMLEASRHILSRGCIVNAMSDGNAQVQCPGSCGYDGSRCTCIRCNNFAMCHTWVPPDMLASNGGICPSCEMMWGKKLTFRFPPPGEICCVCMGTEQQIQFKQCQHWSCTQCMRNIMYWDETRYHIDPCRFGCPPCPNGCPNPARGAQCYCEEYDAVKEEWQRTNPAEYQSFNDAEEASIDEGEPASSAFASRRCPICRQPQ